MDWVYPYFPFHEDDRYVPITAAARWLSSEALVVYLELCVAGHSEARGIGQVIAIELTHRGTSLVITYAKDAESAQSTVDTLHGMEGEGLVLRADDAQAEGIRIRFGIAVEALGHLGTEVSNPRPGSLSHLLMIMLGDFDRALFDQRSRTAVRRPNDLQSIYPADNAWCR